jgi:hypothetical protein
MGETDLTQKSNQELIKLYLDIAARYDSQSVGLPHGFSEYYTPDDVVEWAARLIMIQRELMSRPISNPKVTYSRFLSHGEAGYAGAIGWRAIIADDACVRERIMFCPTEAAAREFVGYWCKDHQIDPATLPEQIHILI